MLTWYLTWSISFSLQAAASTPSERGYNSSALLRYARKLEDGATSPVKSAPAFSIAPCQKNVLGSPVKRGLNLSLQFIRNETCRLRKDRDGGALRWKNSPSSTYFSKTCNQAYILCAFGGRIQSTKYSRRLRFHMIMRFTPYTLGIRHRVCSAYFSLVFVAVWIMLKKMLLVYWVVGHFWWIIYFPVFNQCDSRRLPSSYFFSRSCCNFNRSFILHVARCAASVGSCWSDHSFFFFFHSCVPQKQP